jgi:Flp pilus assembly protein TadD
MKRVTTRRVRRVWTIGLCLLMAGVMSCGAPSEAPDFDSDTIAANNRGVALMGQFDFESARRVFAELVESHPDLPDLKVNLAIATLNRQDEGDEERAKGILDEVLEAHPNHLRALYTRGLLLLYVGDSEAAYSDFLAVAEVDSEDPEAAYHVGQSLMQLGRVEEAAEWFQRAVDGDPYLSSASYRSFQALQRLGRTDEAEVFLDRFRALEGNPRARQMEFKYTRMGHKAEVEVLGVSTRVSHEQPAGPVFDPPTPLVADDVGRCRSDADRPPNVTTCDVNHDGFMDLFVAGCAPDGGDHGNLVVLSGGSRPEIIKDHPLARVTGINAALWGDVDNNGLTDVYLCRRGLNELWLQTALGEWAEVATSAGAAGGNLDTVDGALFDADHDGDLDIFAVNADGDNELFNNDRDGGFRALAEERGLAGGAQASRAVIISDLDGDLDADVIVINERPPHQVLSNRLLWDYHPAEGFADFANAEVEAAVAGDVDGDGRNELYAVGRDGAVVRWSRDSSGTWTSETLVVSSGGAELEPRRLDLADVDGDGVLDLLLTGGGWRLHSAVDGRLLAAGDGGMSPAGLFVLEPLKGPSMVGWSGQDGLRVWPPGSGRYSFVALKLSGKDDDANSLRTNASGIGTTLAARIGTLWTVLDTYRSSSGPGQSLEPVVLGLAGASAVDFVSIDWSDAVLQTEMNLAPGEVHTITETQRQMSSCPVLFAWDGQRYDFVTDLLGVGGMGYAVGPGEYAEARPWENLMLPDGVPQPRDGMIALKLTEPMEEAAYLDAVHLVAYDIPPGWSMSVDDRMAVSGPSPTGRPVFYRVSAEPVRAYNERGEDVTDAMAEADHRAAPVGELDRRFIGRLAGEHVLTLEFDEALNWLGRRLALVADGWVEYPYSSTSFAAWQAGADYRAPTLEARGSDGRWTVVLETFGYPAGMPRQISVPLPRLPAGTTALRLRSNMEVYWDRVKVVGVEVTEEIVRGELKLAVARVENVGFALRTTGSQRLPDYDHDRRVPLWDTRVQPGFYTAFGDALELLSAADDASAIIGPGEGIHLEFVAPAAALPPGWSRIYVLETEGWCKDMDLYTKDGATLEPIPAAGRASSATAMLRSMHNTRFAAGG